MPSRALNRALWAVMLVAIALLAWRYSNRFLDGAGSLDVATDIAPDTLHLSWSGEVRHPMADRIATAFRDHGGERRRIVLVLDSPGGSLSHGNEVIRELKRIGRTHALETVVQNRSICASMCVPIYLQGQLRTASAGARFMFHEVKIVDPITNERQPQSEKQKAANTTQFLDLYFRPAGVSESWINDVAIKIRGRDYWRTGQQLVDEKAGIVQQLN
jgi:ATP-dependent protease ClpP protease subunit